MLKWEEHQKVCTWMKHPEIRIGEMHQSLVGLGICKLYCTRHGNNLGAAEHASDESAEEDGANDLPAQPDFAESRSGTYSEANGQNDGAGPEACAPASQSEQDGASAPASQPEQDVADAPGSQPERMLAVPAPASTQPVSEGEAYVAGTHSRRAPTLEVESSSPNRDATPQANWEFWGLSSSVYSPVRDVETPQGAGECKLQGLEGASPGSSARGVSREARTKEQPKKSTHTQRTTQRRERRSTNEKLPAVHESGKHSISPKLRGLESELWAWKKSHKQLGTKTRHAGQSLTEMEGQLLEALEYASASLDNSEVCPPAPACMRVQPRQYIRRIPRRSKLLSRTCKSR